MGKSTTAKTLARLSGFWLYDVDRVVHRLYDVGGGAAEKIAPLFPDAVKSGAVDRAVLSKLVLGDREKIKKLEGIVHPLTAQAQKEFLATAQKEKAVGVIFDIPLFFETGGHKRGMADFVLVVSAPKETQQKRTMARAGMTKEKFDAILSQQMPNEEKCQLADFVIETGKGLDYTEAEVKKIIEAMTHRTMTDATNNT